MLNLQNISLSFDKVSLLENISLQLEQGEFVAVMGENGCGKSTLLRCIAGIHTHYRGRLTFNQTAMNKWSVRQLAIYRAFVAQHNPVQFAFLTEDVLQLGRMNQAETQKQSSAIICKVAEQLSISHLFGRDVRFLSGGERQRVFIAKSLVQLHPNPNAPQVEQAFQGKLLLLDEPTSALDFRFQKATMDLLKAYCNLGLGLICVSHDINLVLPYATQVVLLADGKCLASGPVDTVITVDNLTQCFGVKPQLIQQANACPYITH